MQRYNSYDHFNPLTQNKYQNYNPQNRSMTPVKINNTTSVGQSIEKLIYLPVYSNEYKNIKWIHLNTIKNLTIFPEKFVPENFNQANTGLCFLFSSLSSIATIPTLLSQIFGDNNNWRKNKSFNLFFFHNNVKTAIQVSDNFPIFQNNWIWSRPANNEIFAKIIEKAYLIYQLNLGKYANSNKSPNELLTLINKVINLDGGHENEAMKLLINSENYNIFNNWNNNFSDNKRIFYEIKKYIDKKALITLARKFNSNDSSGHAYSVLGAWEIKKGKNSIKVLCVKNPWEFGYNQQEKFDINSLNNRLKGFQELIDFNKKYFSPTNNSYFYNQYDYIVGNDKNKSNSSVFIAPIDFLMENGLTQIDIHLPNYKKDFPTVNAELILYDKLDSLFKRIQNNNIKNVYESNINGELQITRVISVGDKNEREIISNLYDKDRYIVTKNGKNYFQVQKCYKGDYNISNMSNSFKQDYVDDLALLTNNKTGKTEFISLDSILNCSKINYDDYSLTTFHHNIQAYDNDNFRQMSNYRPISSFAKVNQDKPFILVDKISTKTLTSFSIVKEAPKPKPKPKPKYTSLPKYSTPYKRSYVPPIKYDYKPIAININQNERINYSNGYYIGQAFNNKRSGKGKMVYNNGGYNDGEWYNDKFISGKTKIVYKNGKYEGGFDNGRKNGYGEEIINGITYRGNYVNGLRHGKFTKIDTDGDVDSLEYEYGEKKFKCVIF